MTRAAAIAAFLMMAGCAARAPARPAGTDIPDPSAVQAFQTATRQCTGLRTVSAEIRLSGRAGDQRLRGTLHAGLSAPLAVRFEAVAPFGPPIFVLAARDKRATLFFPRENRVLVDVNLADVLDRLTGLALGADDLRLILTGCLADGTSASNGRAWPSGWQAVSLGTDVTAYLRARGGPPLVVAADYGRWRVDYVDHLSGWPRQVRIRSVDEGRVDATARLDQLEVNTPIDDKAFSVEVPPNADRMTLDDLRAVAPLRDSSRQKT